MSKMFACSMLLIACTVSFLSIGVGASEHKSPESFEEIGVRILNALIKFGKMELTKAQVQLLQKTYPEKSKLLEQIVLEELTSESLLQKTPSKNFLLPVPNDDDRPQETLDNNWITINSNGTRSHPPVHHASTPDDPPKTPTEQITKMVVDQIQKQIIPGIVKKLMAQRQLPTVNLQNELRPTMTSPEELQRRRHMQQEHIFQKLIDEQNNAKVVQPLRFDIRSQINPLPPEKRYKVDQETGIRPSFKLRRDSVLVNGNSEGEDDLQSEFDSNEYSNDDDEENIRFRRVRGNALARRYIY